MRIEFVAPLLLLAGAVACNDNSNNGSTNTSGGSSTSGGSGGDGGGVTPVGTSTGPVVPGTIGPAGGQLSSADGRFTLIVPAGAVSTPTMFGVEPITNEAPEGIGAAYRVTPDGQMFATPATVSFTYGDADLLGTNEQLLMIAYQDPVAHTWRMDSQATVDTNAKTVQVATTHLTDYAFLAGYNMFPKVAQVTVNGTVNLRVGVCSPPPPGASYYVSCEFPNSPTGFTNWAVNGAQFGTTATGIIKVTDGYHATYTAPSKIPSPNTVTASAQTPGRGATIVVSQIQIIGLTHLDANLNRTGAALCSEATGDVTEHFSLDLDVSAKTISNVKNDPAVVMNVKPYLGRNFSVTMMGTPEFFKPMAIEDIQDGPNETKVVILTGSSTSAACTLYSGSQLLVTDLGGESEVLNMIIPYDASKFDSSGKQTEPATKPPDWTLTLTQ